MQAQTKEIKYGIIILLSQILEMQMICNSKRMETT